MPARPTDGRRRVRLGGALCSAVTLGATGCVEHLRRYDAAVFSTINRAVGSGDLDALMQLASDAVVIVAVWTAVCAYWLASVRSWRQRGLVLATLAVLISVVDSSGNAIKKAVDRVRPCQVIPEARIVSHCPESPSFPSNHASNNFAIAAFVATCQPRLAVITLPVAALVAYSRIHLGVHYPLDVLSGAIAGALLGVAAGAIIRRFAGPAATSMRRRGP